MNEPEQNRRSIKRDMPKCFAWIKDLRAAFGQQEIDRAIRAGMDGGCDFYASENGHEVGNKAPDSGTAVSLSEMVIAPSEEESAGSARKARKGK